MTGPGKKEHNLDDVFDLYCRIFKPLYHEMEAENEVPREALFEILAVVDHLSRMRSYGHSEASAADRAFGHVKRACFDLFKLKVKKVKNLYRKLDSVDLSTIDNGSFEGRLTHLIAKINQSATEARSREGRESSEVSPDDLTAFDLWIEVHALCVEAETEYLLSEKIEWAKRKSIETEKQITRAIGWRTWVIGVSASLVAGLLLERLFGVLSKIFPTQ